MDMEDFFPLLIDMMVQNPCPLLSDDLRKRKLRDTLRVRYISHHIWPAVVLELFGDDASRKKNICRFFWLLLK
jgi:hypothetical protein